MSAPWWRNTELNGHERELLLAILEAHGAVALRGNISGHAVGAAAQGSGRYVQAIAAALMTLGDKHGPIEEAYRFLSSKAVGSVALEKYIAQGHFVPGWGNAFVKNQADPAFDQVDGLLEKHWPEISGKLRSVTAALHLAGKQLYPNPGAYTAAAAMALGIPGSCAGYLFILGRMDAWSHLFNINRSKMSWAQ